MFDFKEPDPPGNEKTYPNSGKQENHQTSKGVFFREGPQNDGLEKVIPLKIALFGIYVSFQGCRWFFQLKHPPNPKITEKLFHGNTKRYSSPGFFNQNTKGYVGIPGG